ncbi:MAG: Flp pilus assembly protein CpaB [Myxococcales bacterium]
MDRKALLIACAATVVGTLLMRHHLARAERELSGGPATDVLVLSRDAEAGERVNRDMLTTRPVPERYLESRHIPAHELPQVLDARLGIDGRLGEALLWTDLEVLRERGRQLAELVPEGMRAFSVRSSRLSDLLRPGDRVDVLASDGDGARRARTVAQNLLVLAVGRNLGDGRASGDRGRRVTLAVSLEQGQLLADAERGSDFHLVLRNPDDVSLAGESAGGAAVVTAGGTE